MKNSTRWPFALGIVVAAALAANSFRLRSGAGADPAASSPEAGPNKPTFEDYLRRGTPPDSSSRDATAATATTVVAPHAAPVAEVPHAAELVSEQSPSPFVREVVQSFGGYGIPAAGPLHEMLERFAAEPLDPISATSTEARLLSAISGSSIPVVDRRVECRAAECSMLLVYPLGTDPSTVRDEVEQLAPSLGLQRGETKAIFWPRADGAPTALVIYRVWRDSTPQSVAAARSDSD